MRVLPVVLLPLFAAAQQSYVRDSQIDRVLPPSFDVANTSASFMMACANARCFEKLTGVFDRTFFRVELAKAVAAVSQEARAVAGSTNPAAEAFTLGDDNLVIDRVVQETNPTEAPLVKSFGVVAGQGSAAWTYGFSTDQNYWNAFIRFRLVDVPTEVLDRLDDVLIALDAAYRAKDPVVTEAQILFDSVWIERDAHFITDQLEPVPGRGHKDQQLLIPLFCGIAAMLIIPAVVSWCLVQRAEVHKRGERAQKRLGKRVEVLQDDLVTKNAIVEQSRENAEARDEEAEHEEEMQRLRDATELTHEEVDWKARPPAQTPY